MECHGAVKVQLDAATVCKDEKGTQFNFPTRMRNYIVGDVGDFPQVLSKIETELQLIRREGSTDE